MNDTDKIAWDADQAIRFAKCDYGKALDIFANMAEMDPELLAALNRKYALTKADRSNARVTVERAITERVDEMFKAVYEETRKRADPARSDEEVAKIVEDVISRYVGRVDFLSDLWRSIEDEANKE